MVRASLIVAAAVLAAAAAPADARLVYEEAKKHRIVALDDGGTGARVIARGFAPSLAPDGRHVAFFRKGKRRLHERLFVVPARGGKPRLVARRVRAVRSRFATGSVDWSPDGERVAAQRANGVDGVVVDLRSGRRTAIEGDRAYGGAAFSPGGSRALVLEVDLRAQRLEVVGVKHGHRRALGEGDCPTWGRPALAYRRGDEVVARSRPSAPERVILSGGEATPCPLAWSSDGSALLLGRESAYPAFDALLTAPDGSDAQALDVPFTQITGVSHDGQRVLGLVDDDVVVAARDGSTRVVAHDATFPSWGAP
jgi:hypothetical protein